MPSRAGLQGVERTISPFLLQLRRDRRQQKRIQQLLSYYIERCAESSRNGRGSETVFDMKLANERSRQQKLAREQVHLDFAALSSTIVPLRGQCPPAGALPSAPDLSCKLPRCQGRPRVST